MDPGEASHEPGAETHLGYACRLRFLASTRLRSEDTERWFSFKGREVRLTGDNKTKPIGEDNWLILVCRGFAAESDAASFGDDLKRALLSVGVATRNGLNLGQDKPTSWIDKNWAIQLGLLEPHERLLRNVHGLMIYPDDDLNRVPSGAPEITVYADIDIFLSSLSGLSSVPEFSPPVRDGLEVLNLGFLNKEPLGRLVLALSSVESLGQAEVWTESQRALLRRLAEQALLSDLCPRDEQEEVAAALKRGLHRVGLRQGVLRILKRLELSQLTSEWDRIYSLRSGLIHGTGKMDEPAVAQLANDALTLCGSIFLTLAEREGTTVPEIAQRNFPARA